MEAARIPRPGKCNGRRDSVLHFKLDIRPHRQAAQSLNPGLGGRVAHTPRATESSTVAPSGEPLRLTELREELLRLIGRPDGMPGSRSGTR